MPKFFPSRLLLLAALALPSHAQAPSTPATRLPTARALYYTPTTAGLKSFHCDVAIDWQAMLNGFSSTPIADDNPVLIYLKTVRLSISDTLHGDGKFIWTDTSTPPENFAPGSAKMRGGMEQMFSAYFSAWNAYMQGDMVPQPDNTVTVTQVGEGIELHGLDTQKTLAEKYDKNMLLTEVHIVNAGSDELDTPTFATTPAGLILTNLHMIVKSPPTASPSLLDIATTYATVGAYQLPATVAFAVTNVGTFNFKLSSCQVNPTTGP